MRLLLCACLLSSFAAGCGSRHPPPARTPAEYSDQEEYAKTPSQGPGSESSQGYYGVGSSGTPERTPATPGR